MIGAGIFFAVALGAAAIFRFDVVQEVAFYGLRIDQTASHHPKTVCTRARSSSHSPALEHPR